MTEQKFPWAMDKPVDELRMMLAEEASYDVLDETLAINYLLTRLKKAESERDERYTKAATSVIREEQERHAATLAKVNARLEVAESALNGISVMDCYDGEEMQDIATDALAKLKSI